MSLADLDSRALAALEAPPVTVEAHLANGVPSFAIVGLPDTDVKAAKDRVRAVLVNCRFEFPARRITVDLAPAELPKESGRFDLPIALGILAAPGQIPAEKLDEHEFAGERSLSGARRAVRGALAMTRSGGPRPRQAFWAVAGPDRHAYRSPGGARGGADGERARRAERHGARARDLCSGATARPAGQGEHRALAARDRDALPHRCRGRNAPQIGARAPQPLRALRLARTIADRAGADAIGVAHIAEAVQYRRVNRNR